MQKPLHYPAAFLTRGKVSVRVNAGNCALCGVVLTVVCIRRADTSVNPLTGVTRLTDLPVFGKKTMLFVAVDGQHRYI